MRVPRGIIIMWTGVTIPDGWLICDGFNDTPNLYDKFILSYGTTYSTISAAGGDDTHQLLIDEIPSHNHTATVEADHNAAHAHPIPSTSTNDEEGEKAEHADGTDSLAVSSSFADGIHSHTLTLHTNTPADTAHENMPPYYVLAYIMKE